MARLTQKERETLECIRNITHESIEKINNILLGLMTQALLNYVDGEPMHIPYFGTFLVRCKGDEITDKGKEAVLETFFSPSPSFKENIGSYEDFKSSPSKDINQIPIIKYLNSMNEQSLRMTLNDMVVEEISE